MTLYVVAGGNAYHLQGIWRHRSDRDFPKVDSAVDGRIYDDRRRCQSEEGAARSRHLLRMLHAQDRVCQGDAICTWKRIKISHVGFTGLGANGIFMIGQIYSIRDH